MLLNRLRDHFGDIPAEQEAFITDELENLEEDEQNKIFNFIVQNSRQKDGCPNQDFFKKALDTVKPKKTYFWAVCEACGAEYDFQLSVCPKCYKDGYKCTARTVKSSSMKPQFGLLRYNKHFLNGNADELRECGHNSCYDCELNDFDNFCFHFGDPNYVCEKFRNCKCFRCCKVHKDDNRIHLSGPKEDVTNILKTPVTKKVV